MKRIFMYGYFGIHNHGNEAIIRGFSELLENEKFTVITSNITEDINYGLNDCCFLQAVNRPFSRYSPINLLGHIMSILNKGVDKLRIEKQYASFINTLNVNDIVLFEAGDQCFEDDATIKNYMIINRLLKKRNVKLIFFLGSVPINNINRLIPFLNDYDKILLRESISYNALSQSPLASKAFFMPCTAFQMKAKARENLVWLTDKPIVGLTIGFLTQNKEQYNSVLLSNILELINYILKNTNYNIALIPHVNVPPLSDITFFDELCLALTTSNRIKRYSELRADEAKFVISKCNVFVTVRTHASIAAYSSFVPTLVIGYSQKSRGLAQDLFGNEDLLLSIDSLQDKNKLIKKFIELLTGQDEIRCYLKNKIPAYLEKHKELLKIIEEEDCYD